MAFYTVKHALHTPIFKNKSRSRWAGRFGERSDCDPWAWGRVWDRVQVGGGGVVCLWENREGGWGGDRQRNRQVNARARLPKLPSSFSPNGCAITVCAVLFFGPYPIALSLFSLASPENPRKHAQMMIPRILLPFQAPTSLEKKGNKAQTIKKIH